MIEKSIENTPIQLRYYSTIDSTNIKASQIAGEGAPEWTVIAAGEQRKGKGRYQRQWLSSPGMGLLVSIILRPKIRLNQIQFINLFTALAISNFIEMKIDQKELTNKHSVDLKWPNDILIDRKKICGILLESKIKMQKLDYVIAGIGLNLNQSEGDFSPKIRNTAVSLKMIIGEKLDLNNILYEFLTYYYYRFVEMTTTDFDSVVKEYQQKLLFKDQPVQVKLQNQRKTGINRGIDKQGYLILETPQGKEKITAGDIWGYDVEEKI